MGLRTRMWYIYMIINVYFIGGNAPTGNIYTIPYNYLANNKTKNPPKIPPKTGGLSNPRKAG